RVLWDRIDQGVALECRRGVDRLADEPEHAQLVLTLERHIYPVVPRPEREVPWPEASSAVGRDGTPVRQHAVGVVEDLQRAGVFRSVHGRIVASGDEDGGGVG